MRRGGAYRCLLHDEQSCLCPVRRRNRVDGTKHETRSMSHLARSSMSSSDDASDWALLIKAFWGKSFPQTSATNSSLSHNTPASCKPSQSSPLHQIALSSRTPAFLRTTVHSRNNNTLSLAAASNKREGGRAARRRRRPTATAAPLWRRGRGLAGWKEGLRRYGGVDGPGVEDTSGRRRRLHQGVGRRRRPRTTTIATGRLLRRRLCCCWR